MLYGIYNKDNPDEDEGRLVQVNKIWHTSDADDAFEDGVRSLGHSFVKRESEYVLSPEHYYVDISVEELIDRPDMPVEVSKKHIKAGKSDFTTLTGIPTASKFRIMAGNIEYQSGKLDSNGTEIELSVPVPCTCTIILDKWPFKTFTAKVEVHA
jgi:hypothetical protein